MANNGHCYLLVDGLCLALQLLLFKTIKFNLNRGIAVIANDETGFLQLNIAKTKWVQWWATITISIINFDFERHQAGVVRRGHGVRACNVFKSLAYIAHWSFLSNETGEFHKAIDIHVLQEFFLFISRFDWLMRVWAGFSHDDVIKWKHFPRYWPFVRGIHRSAVNSPHKGQWLGALMSPLICPWIDGCANNRDTGDLGRHRAHYDVTVMLVISDMTHHSSANFKCEVAFLSKPIKFDSLVVRGVSVYMIKHIGENT